MRLHRFYISTPIQSKTFDITNQDLVHQWKSVFRYNVGSQVVLFDGLGTDYFCLITSLRNVGATVSVVKKNVTTFSPLRNLTLCVSLIKKDNFEFVVEKATELGVSTIIPILSDRSEKKKIHYERLVKISIEASEQSGRGTVPVIHPLASMNTLFESKMLPKNKIAMHPEGNSLQSYIQTAIPSSLAVLIGPEGGWAEKEIELFALYNIEIISLGSQILRTETAVISTLSLLLL